MAFANVPVPFEDHVTLAWLVAEEPPVMFTGLSLVHILRSVPAAAVGSVLIVRTLLDVASTHGETPEAVSVIVTLPAAMSVALGSYVASVKEFTFVNVPLPSGELQVIPELFADEEPPVIFIAPEFEQVLRDEPALAVVAPLIEMFVPLSEDATLPLLLITLILYKDPVIEPALIVPLIVPAFELLTSVPIIEAPVNEPAAVDN